MSDLTGKVAKWTSGPWFILTVVLAGSIAAILGGAVFISDGAYFLYQTVNSQSIETPHLRLTFSMLLYPALVATRLTEDFTFIRWIYSIPLVIAPVLTLALSWWVVRKTQQSLFVWATLGILLVNLPGQMHWVATSIRTNQIFWPLLLAILIGMPNRVVPMAIILAQLMLVLHPHAAGYFAAGTLAALWIGYRQPELRHRMFAIAGLGAFFASFRLLIPTTGYENDVTSIDYQLTLFELTVISKAGIGLLFTALASISIFLRGRQRPFSIPHWLTYVFLFGAAISFVVWGLDGEQWRNVTSYRSPNLLFSLLLMGLAFIDSTWRPEATPSEAVLAFRNRAAGIAAVIFCLTISIQSILMSQEINRVESIMSAAEPGCVAESQIPGFSESVLYHSTFPMASVMMQSRTPDRVVLPDAMCDQVAETGDIPMFRTPDGQVFRSGWIDMWSLRYNIAGSGQCWARMSDGWHDRERGQDGSWGQWSRDSGRIRITVDEPKSVALTLDLRAFTPGTEVTFVLNDEELKTVAVTNEFKTIFPIPLNLNSGDNWLELQGNQEPASPPASSNSLSRDPRAMTFMIWDLSLLYDRGQSACTIR